MINCEAIVKGAQLAIQAINDASSGILRTKAQWLTGYLYHNRDFNGFIAYKYYQLMSEKIHVYKNLTKDVPCPQIVHNGLLT